MNQAVSQRGVCVAPLTTGASQQRAAGLCQRGNQECEGFGSGLGLLAGGTALCVLTTFELSELGPYSTLAGDPDHGY